MQLQVWRHIGKNPCNNPPVKITIAPMGDRLTTYRMTLGGVIPRKVPLVPWVLPIEMAIALFTREIVDLIGEEPVLVELKLEILSPDASRGQ